jgi:putative MATE family efflux protein
MTKDLTEGKPLPLILGFSLPLLGGYVFQQFYNVVDTVIVGKFLGKECLAALGATGSVNFLIIGFCMGICSGFSIPIAQKYGAKDYKTMRQFVASSIYLGIFFSIVLTILTLLFCRPLLRLMLTPENIIGAASDYISIIFAGIPVVFLYNILAGILRSLGDSKTPLLFLIISSVLNIFLDLLFIIVFKLGVKGAALATVLSQGVSGILCLVYMYKKFDILRLNKDDRKIRTNHFVVLCGNGVPMGLQYSITAIGSVILQSSVNSLGSDVVAAVAAAQKINIFFCCPFDALGTTMATWGGQNLGARKLERLKSGLYACCFLGFIYSILGFIIMLLFGDTLGLLFVSSSEVQILENIGLFLIIVSIFYFSLALVNIVRFLIQGMGFSSLAIMSGVLEMIARTVTALFFVTIFGYLGVCFASPFAWILADCFLIPAFIWCYKKLQKEW